MRLANAFGPTMPSVTAATAGAKIAPAARRERLRRGDKFEPVNKRQREARQRHHDGRRDHQAALGRAPVDQGAGGGLGENTGQRRNRHHHADAGLIPFLFGQKIDREIGAEPIAHVGEKEIQRIQRPLDLCFAVGQAVLALAAVPASQRLRADQVPSLQRWEKRSAPVPTVVRIRARFSGSKRASDFAACDLRRYPPTPFSLKYFSAPGWNGTGERACTWLSSEKLSASLCTATMSAFFSTSVLTMA